jgi:hypothetical protein
VRKDGYTRLKIHTCEDISYSYVVYSTSYFCKELKLLTPGWCGLGRGQLTVLSPEGKAVFPQTAVFMCMFMFID